ncbi:MAG: beta strand repeat-containing protein, partial [Bacteroidia bacterium]
MKQSRLALLAFLLCFCPLFSFGQVTGIQTVPGSFATLEAAVTALNATGVGAGGATINVAAGYTETPTTSLILTMATNGPTAANPLVIQKSGSGANPLITAFTPGISATVDGIFILNGVDYVTINGIDLQENAANVTATTQMEWGYALTKTSGTNGAQYNTIKNCIVTLNKANIASVGIYLGNHLSNTTVGLTVSSVAGPNSFNKFYNNTVTNCYNGYSITGFASAAPYDFYDQSNQIGTDGVSTRRNQVTNYGGATTAANGITATNQNGLSIFKTYINNNGGAPQLGTLNGINTATGLNSSVNIYNDTLTLSSASTTGTALVGINNAMGGTGAGNTVNIYNNVVDACTYTTNTSGLFRGVVSTASASYTNMYNNKVTNNSMPGTGELSGIYYAGSSATLCLVVNLNDNVVSGNTKTGTAGTMNLLYASGSTNTTNCYNNQLFNNNNSTSSGTTYGYYNFAFGYSENVYNNQMYNNTGGAGETYMIHARSGSGPTNKEIYGNLVHTILGNSAAATVGAIYVDYGTTTNVYKNNVYNISNTSTTGGVPATAGIIIGGFVNTLTNVYNNFVSELKAPNATSTTACIMGIWLNGSTTSVMNAYYNTVYLNATGVGTNFGSSAVYCGPNPVSIDLRNNIFVNISNATGTGLTRAITRSNTTITSYSLTSGYNCLFAGTPSATNLIYHDFTNADQTLQAFKNRVGPREQASFSALPPFINVAVSPYDLHLQNSVATQCEGGGKAIVGFTLDYDNATRGATPDVGADEISGITVDIAAPDIQYTLLTNSAVAPNRVLNAFATITDP